MPAGQVEEFLALSIVFFVHIVGGVMLVWGILGDEERKPWRRWWGRGGGEDEPRDPDPSPEGERASLPLPLSDAAASRVRLREDGRLADGYPRPARRPEHAPPVPAPSRD